MTDETKSPSKVRRRTLGRELAVKVLYQWDLMKLGAGASFDDLAVGQEDDAEAIGFAKALVSGVKENQAEVDEAIRASAKNWDLYRMAVVDRNIIRIATYEMMKLQETPAKVAINEAVELAKKFSTAGSGAFVNGVLDEIRRCIAARPGQSGDPEPEGREPS